MTYAVIIAPAAGRNLEQVPARIVPAIIEFIFGDLARTPRKVGKPLGRELEGSYGARRGPYRVIFTIDEPGLLIKVLRIEHRADVYRPQ